MPCCCKDNVQACFVLGIILVVLNLLSCFGFIWNAELLPYCLIGIFGALVSGILIFGAKKRNRIAILVWIVFAIIGVVVLIAFAVIAIMVMIAVSSNDPDDDDPDDVDALERFTAGSERVPVAVRVSA